jgi:hypothetical protein
MEKKDLWSLTDGRDMRLEERYLDKYVFYGLKNLNNGFDASSIRYHSAAEFKIVMERCEKLGIGLNGIEPWIDGEFYDVITKEDLGADAADPVWYNLAFDEFVIRGVELQYSATYQIPEKLLEDFRKEREE